MIAALAVLAGCQLPLDHASCPCVAGWVCCAASQVCVAEQSTCPDETPEPASTQRLSIDRPWFEDLFGMSIAISGDLLAVGVPGSDRASHDGGEVLVFERRGDGTGVWVRIAVLTAPEPTAKFGTALAFVGGEQLVIGAPSGPGRAYVFRRDGDGWSWRETLKPDFTNVQEEFRNTLGFGNEISADGDHFVISGYESIAFLYQLTEVGTQYVTQLITVRPSGQLRPWSGVTMHGASALFFDARSEGVYVFDESAGWAGTRVTDLAQSTLAPRMFAFDGTRVAVAGKPGLLRIVERTASGWGTPTDVPLPADPEGRKYEPWALAWHGDGLVMTCRPFGALTGMGFAHVRSVAGAWVPDPIIAQPGTPEWTAIAVSGDRAVVSDPYTPLTAAHSAGAATVYRLDGGSYVKEATITREDRAEIRSVAAGPGYLIANRTVGEQLPWFGRDADGQYRARPALALGPGLRLGAQVVASGSHVLMTVYGHDGSVGVQAFEIGAHDWSTGTFLPAPEGAETRFPAESQTLPQTSIALDGDTAVISLHTAPPERDRALIYAFANGSWVQTETLPGPCDLFHSLSVALNGNYLAAYCGDTSVRMLQRDGVGWTAMAAPVIPGAAGILRIILSGERALVVSYATGDGHRMTDVVRWTGTAWQSELHLDAIGVAFAGDRLVLARDTRSVTPYRLVNGAWVEQSPISLPDQPRSPDATLADIAVTDDGLVMSVKADAGDTTVPEGAIYVLPWPIAPR